VHLSGLKINLEPECHSLSLIFTVIASSCQVLFKSSQLEYKKGTF
jgi:hypothetical protein